MMKWKFSWEGDTVARPVGRDAVLASRIKPIPVTLPTFVRLKDSSNSKNSVTRATRRLSVKRTRIYDIPCTLMLLTRLAVGLEPLNALDAAHRAPRFDLPWQNRSWVPR